MTSVGLVACCKPKLPHAAQAQDLYVSQLFRAAREYCERVYDRWYILSAKYGLVLPTQVIEPYDVEMRSLTPPERRVWGRRARERLREEFPGELPMLYMHAGHNYCVALDPESWRYPVSYPVAGLFIGQQHHWYAVRRPVYEPQCLLPD